MRKRHEDKILSHKKEAQKLENSLIRRFLKGGEYTKIFREYRYTKFLLKKNNGVDISLLLKMLVENYSTSVEFRTIKVAGVNHTVPFEMTNQRRTSVLLRKFKFLVASSKKETFHGSLFNEYVKLTNRSSDLLKEKELVHRKAENNKAYLNYKW